METNELGEWFASRAELLKTASGKAEYELWVKVEADKARERARLVMESK